jgi:hypothetical protein
MTPILFGYIILAYLLVGILAVLIYAWSKGRKNVK